MHKHGLTTRLALPKTKGCYENFACFVRLLLLYVFVGSVGPSLALPFTDNCLTIYNNYI